MIQLELTNGQGESRCLNFQVRPTPVAQRWLESVTLASSHSEFRENDRLYNFPNHQHSEEKFIVDKVRDCVDRINAREPGRIPVSIPENFTQQDVNIVHTFFVDSEMTGVWAELNNWLHAHEAFVRSQDRLAESGIAEANILVTWRRQFIQPLRDEDYEHFTVAKKFGTCYVSYCQVGRHLYEMYLAGDTVAADDHILPLRQLSADTYIWLGPTSGPKSFAKNKENIAAWFKANEQKLNRLGFHWGDPKLAIGWIPVADLTPEVTALAEQNSFLKNVSGMKTVRSFRPT